MAVQSSEQRRTLVQCGYTLHCSKLNCTVLHRTALLCTAQHCFLLSCSAMKCTTLQCSALHCTALHFIPPCAALISLLLHRDRLGTRRHPGKIWSWTEQTSDMDWRCRLWHQTWTGDVVFDIRHGPGMSSLISDMDRGCRLWHQTWTGVVVFEIRQ